MSRGNRWGGRGRKIDRARRWIGGGGGGGGGRGRLATRERKGGGGKRERVVVRAAPNSPSSYIPRAHRGPSRASATSSQG